MEEKSLRDEIGELKEIIKETGGKNKKKPKEFKLPFKAKINNSKLKSGYVTVVKIEENRGVDFIREPIKDGTIKLDGDTFHAVKEEDIFHYKGKPIIFQPKNKLNPYNPLQDKHETYGQKYIMARMEGDKITNKKKIGLGMSIGVMIIIGIIIYAIFFGGGG